MSQFAIDTVSGELIRRNGSFVRVTGAQEVLQHVHIRLRLFRGECLYNETLGVRYFGLVFEPGTPPERVEGEISDQILGTPGVVSVDDLDLEVDTEARRGEIDWDGTLSLDDAAERIPIHDRFSVTVRGDEVL